MAYEEDNYYQIIMALRYFSAAHCYSSSLEVVGPRAQSGDVVCGILILICDDDLIDSSLIVCTKFDPLLSRASDSQWIPCESC